MIASVKSGMIALMKRKPMNNPATIYTRIPKEILIKAGLLSAVQHISRTKVLSQAIKSSHSRFPRWCV